MHTIPNGIYIPESTANSSTSHESLILTGFRAYTTRTTVERSIRKLKAGGTAIDDSAVMLELLDTSTVLNYTKTSKWICSSFLAG